MIYLINGFGIILLLQGAWNLIGVWIKEDDIIANSLIFLLGIILWATTRKPDEPYVQMYDVPVGAEEDTETENATIYGANMS